MTGQVLVIDGGELVSLTLRSAPLDTGSVPANSRYVRTVESSFAIRNPADGTIASLERALTLLEHLGRSAPLHMTELSHQLEVPKGSLHRHLAVLERRGYVARDHSKRYSLGPRVISLGYDSTRQQGLVEVARPVMAALRDEFNESILLAVLSTGDVVHVHVEPSRHPVKMAAEVGERTAAHVSSLGKAILAWSDPDVAAGRDQRARPAAIHRANPRRRPPRSRPICSALASAGTRSTMRSRPPGCAASGRRSWVSTAGRSRRSASPARLSASPRRVSAASRTRSARPPPRSRASWAGATRPGAEQMRRIGIDTGGTFSDLILLDEAGGVLRRAKVPSTPDDPARAVAAGLERLLDGEDSAEVHVVVGTTVATNAVIERRGPRVLFVYQRRVHRRSVHRPHGQALAV